MRVISGWSRTWNASEDGVSLVELLVAVLIFGIIAGGTISLMVSSLSVTRDARGRTVAASLAESEIERVRSLDLLELCIEGAADPIGQCNPFGADSTSVQTVSGADYTVRRQAQWITSDAAGSSCDGPDSSVDRLAHLRVDVEVTWISMTSGPVRSQTILTPEVGLFDPLAGNIGLKVVDRDQEPLRDIVVNLSHPSVGTQTQLTTTEGCAFFAQLDAESGVPYELSFSRPGYVDTKRENAVRVVVGDLQPAETSRVRVEYDEAAELVLDVEGGTSAVLPLDLPLTVELDGELIPYPDTGVEPRTVSDLYPFPAGAFAWAGDCGQDQPTIPPNFALTPGSSTTAMLTAPDVLIRVFRDEDGDGQEDDPFPGVEIEGAARTVPGECASGVASLTYPPGTQTDLTGEVRVGATEDVWTFSILDPRSATGRFQVEVDLGVTGTRTVECRSSGCVVVA